MQNITIHDLTKSQQIAFKGLSDWLESPITNDPNTQVAVLSGKAGTGKTTLIKLILDQYLEEDRQKDPNTNFAEEMGFKKGKMQMLGLNYGDTPNVWGVTVAHKAKNVLARSIHFVNTFASYFGLKEQYDQSGKLEFIQDEYKMQRSNCRLPHRVAVHDECSMYDESMKNTVLTNTRQNVKIIFMGDPHQLPPISSEGDDDSPIFKDFKNIWFLEERVRQTEGNPIIDLSDIVAEQIFREIKFGEVDDRISIVLNAIKESKIIDGKGFDFLKYRDFLAHYKNSSEDYLDSKVVAYRRDKVLSFNQEIRKYLHGNPYAPYIPGEIIYMNETYYSENDDTDKKFKWVCYNSDEYKILDVAKHSIIEDVDCDLLYVDKTNHKHLASVSNPYIPIVSKEGMKSYNQISFFRKRGALEAEPRYKAGKWKYYYDFTNMFGNVSYGYCYTAHKSQGSTFKNVYVDINDILTIGPISVKRKLQAIYTAITRASHLVIFLKSN